MFTGLIQSMGKITKIEPNKDNYQIEIKMDPIFNFDIGSSICTSGTCLTAVERTKNSFTASVMPQTLDLTTLKDAQVGDQVNLEPSLHVGDEIGGHFVYGHVDGVGEITNIREVGDTTLMTIRPPEDLMRYIAPQGSVAIDGVSLTVADASDDQFTVSLVQYTLEHTTLGQRKIGEKLNIETDMMIKYLENLHASK